jgi:hypothetical protein
LIADGFHSNFTAKEFPRFLPVRMLASLDLWSLFQLDFVSADSTDACIPWSFTTAHVGSLQNLDLP